MRSAAGVLGYVEQVLVVYVDHRRANLDSAVGKRAISLFISVDVD
jgi:hypothetical protein